MKPEIAAIYGSPRKHGLSSSIHDSFLKPFAEKASINKIYVYDEKILPCNACGVCGLEEKCPADDSMNKIYSIIKKADLISISSPLYFSSLPGQLKNLIDRCEIFWNNKIENKSGLGFFISSAGNDVYKNMFLPSVTVIRHFFRTIDCLVNVEDFILMSGTDSAEKVPDAVLDDAVKKGGIYLNKIMKYNKE